MKHWSLKTKALVYIALAALLPLLISSIYLYDSSKQEVINKTVDKIQLKQQAKDYMISSSIDSIIDELSILSRSNVFVDEQLDNQANFLSQELSLLDQSFIGLGFINNIGEIDYFAKNETLQKPFIQKLTAQQEVIIDGQSYDEQGNIIAHIVVPVFNNKQHLNGSLFTSFYFPPNYYEEQENNLPMENTYIYTLTGDLMFQPNLVPHTISGAGQYSDVFYSYLEEHGSENIHAMVYSHNLKKYVIAHRLVNENQWMMLDIIPMSEINKETFPSLVRTISSILIAIIIASIVFYIYFNSIISRLYSIVKVTKQGSNGSLNVEYLDASIKDEIGILSHSINGMMNRLEIMFSRLEAVINQNQSPVVVLDEHYRFSYVNKAAEEMLGIESEAILGKFTPISFMEFAEVEMRAQQFSQEVGYHVPPGPDLFIELRKKYANYDMEFTIVSSNGERIPVYDRSSVIRDKDGKMIGIISILQDLSKHRQVEQARDRLQDIVESARDLIASVDRQSNIIYINEAGKRMLGIQNEEVHNLKQSLPDHIHQMLIDNSVYARQDGYFEMEAQFVNFLGERINVSISIVSHEDTYTGELLYSCIARDLTELLDTQERLVEATQLAENAAAAKGNFLALMSHEIRTPLNGIIGLSQLLEKTKLDKLQREYATKIKDSSNTLLHIVNDILDFSKLEVSKIELEQRLFNMHHVIDHINVQVSHYLGGKDNFEFKIVVDEALPQFLLGDSLRFEQVLTNLCINAVKFTPQGIVRLELKVEQLNEQDVTLKVTVEDSGIGMSDEQLSKLFTPFTQADSSTTRQFGGTGLGLVIAQTLVQLMGGQLQVESELYRGSKFSFVIPLQFPEQLESNPALYVTEDKFFAWVIEDSEELTAHWVELLNKQKIAALSLNSWKEGYYRLSRLGKGIVPSVIILDMEMADMYGIDTWLRFKAEATKFNIPIVVLTTTYGHEELAMLNTEVQPHLVLTKPVQPHAFQMSIYELLTNGYNVPLHITKLEEQKDETIAVRSLSATSHHYHILIAEDNKVNQLVVEDMLKYLNINVSIVNNGLEAIEKIQKEAFDLVLMDIHMPIMDGIEATKWIRSRDQYKHIPIIAVTANMLQSDHEQYKQVGMQYVMTKPLELTSIINVLNKYLHSNKHNGLQLATKQQVRQTLNESSSVYQSLDVQQALERLNGKENIYRHMLGQFAVDYKHFTASLSENVEVGNLKAAQRMLHTLKGASSYIGASQLYYCATQMEQLVLEANIERLINNFPTLEKKIVHVIEDIMTLLEKD